MKKSYLLLALSLFTIVGCNVKMPASSAASSAPQVSEASSEAVSSSTGSSNFSCSVKLEDGSTYKGNAYAQWCTSTSCLMPVKLNNGYCENILIKTTASNTTTYFVHLDQLESTYVYNPNLQADVNNKNTEITLYTLKTAGVNNSISTGAYKATIPSADAKVNFELALEKTGRYTIESWIDTNAVTNEANYDADPKIYCADSLLDDNSGFGNNFKYSFEATGENAITLSLTADRVMEYYFIVSYQAA